MPPQGAEEVVLFTFPSGEGGAQRRKRSSSLYKIKGDPRNGLFWAACTETRTSLLHTLRASARSKGFRLQAARALGISDRGTISVQGILVRAGGATPPLQASRQPLFLSPVPCSLLPVALFFGHRTPPLQLSSLPPFQKKRESTSVDSH